MHLLVSLAGGASCTLFVYHLFKYRDPDGSALPASVVAGIAFVIGLVLMYVVAVVKTTADGKLQSAAGGR
jgi:hypothetical protein